LQTKDNYTMKKTYTILPLLVCIALCGKLSAQPVKNLQGNNFLVHVTAFLENRPITYFYNLEGVFAKEDNKGIWHYFMGSYKTLEEADEVKRSVVAKGYPYAYVVDVEKVRRECKLTCDSDPSIDPSVPSVMRQIRSLHHLLFDFRKHSLTMDSKSQLDKLATILNGNAMYRVEFKGHTDAIGTPEFNQALSERRSNASKDYIANKGVADKRMTTSSYGMENPIAKNLRNGKDCPEGRKFNRRVELFITDAEGNVLNALIEPFDIPNELVLATHTDEKKLTKQ
jgi:outer membrane protein OmpA-like peptidoglycan-associated protein